MGYTDFETDNAIYRVELIHHNDAIEGNFKADAFILEGPDARGLSNIKNLFSLASSQHMKSAEEFCARNNIPTFLPDVAVNFNLKSFGVVHAQEIGVLIAAISLLSLLDSKHKIPRRLFLSTLSVGTLTWLISRYLYFGINLKGKIDTSSFYYQFDKRIHEYLDLALVEARNAINAKKVEEFIAPELRRRLGRKPIIYVAFGAAHFGIVDCFKDRTYRNDILSRFLDQDVFKSENLRGCVELHIAHDGTFDYKIHENIIKLPKPSSEMLDEKRRLLEQIKRRLELEKQRVKPRKFKEDESPQMYNRRELFTRLFRPKV